MDGLVSQWRIYFECRQQRDNATINYSVLNSLCNVCNAFKETSENILCSLGKTGYVECGNGNVIMREEYIRFSGDLIHIVIVFNMCVDLI